MAYSSYTTYNRWLEVVACFPRTKSPIGSGLITFEVQECVPQSSWYFGNAS